MSEEYEVGTDRAQELIEEKRGEHAQHAALLEHVLKTLHPAFFPGVSSLPNCVLKHFHYHCATFAVSAKTAPNGPSRLLGQTALSTFVKMICGCHKRSSKVSEKSGSIPLQNALPLPLAPLGSIEPLLLNTSAKCFRERSIARWEP